MKWISNILILILIWFISGGRSCTEDGNQLQTEEKLFSTSRDSIINAFEVGSPDDQLLRAYETIAIQKLIDLTDYLRIASDSSMDSLFRNQAVVMARKLFIAGKADAGNWYKAYAGTNPGIMGQPSGKSLSNGMTCTVDPDQIIIKTPLYWKNDSTFAGNLSFCQKFIPSADSNLQESFSRPILIDIYALKVVKSFGKERIRIWEVYLGDLY
jgi:hypothetical protein